MKISTFIQIYGDRVWNSLTKEFVNLSSNDIEFIKKYKNVPINVTIPNNLIDLGRYSKLIKNHGYIINYHLNKAVYNFIVNQNIAEAESEINLLDRYYPKVNSKCRTWNYSKAFLVACKNDAKEYDSIQMLYKKIVDDVVQDPLNIYYFLNRYLQDNPNNTGVKIALFWLVYYKQDLNKDLIDDNFIEEIIFDLQKFQNESLSNNILACYKEMKDRKI